MITYPREDKCVKCDTHIGWVMNKIGEAVALGVCEKCSGTEKEFKLVRIVKIYEKVIIKAYSPKDALEAYNLGCIDGGWEEDDVGCSEEIGLTSISERGKEGEFSITYDVKKGKFV